MKIKPCIEDLNEMAPTAGGKFCKSCDKTIYDLRDKSAEEINQLYLDSNGKLCGIVGENQLPESKYYHPLKRFAFALMLVFGSTLFIFATGYQEDFERIRARVVMTISNEDASHMLTGFLYSNNQPIVNTSYTIVVGGQSFVGRTDKTGNFSVNLPDFATANISISIQTDKYETVLKTIDLQGSSQFVGKITLTKKMDCIKMGDIAPEVEILKSGEIQIQPEKPPLPGNLVPSENDKFE